MPRAATGTTYQKGGRWYAQVTLDATTRPKIPLPTCATEEAAEARRVVLADLATNLRRASVPVDVARTLLIRAGEAAEGKDLDKVRRTIDAVCSGEARPAPSKTFRDVGESWTSGDLARLYPDHVRPKQNADDDRAVLARHVYPFVEDVPIASFTLDHADRIMRALPHTEPATRRGYALLVNRICTLAVFPLRLIPANPLPHGWVPSRGAPKAKGYLYPDEDRKLLGCTKVPLCWRVFYGFLAREGCRAYTEAATFTLADVDLDRGSIKLDENKTDDPRAWALDAGVVRALRAWCVRREQDMGRPMQPDDRLFVDEDGRSILDTDHHADHFRAYLMAAGVDRPELFQRAASRRRIRVHDLRATFITTNSANGKNEAWISDRTGHKSSKEIQTYRRQTRHAAELELGTLAPLDVAIPELGAGGRNGGPESPPGGPGSAPAAPKGSEPGGPEGGNPGGSPGALPLATGADYRRPAGRMPALHAVILRGRIGGRRGRIAPQGGRLAAQGGRIAPQGGRIAPQGGRIAPQGGRIAPQGGRIAPQEGRIAAQGGRLAAQGGRLAAQGGRIAAQEGRLPEQEGRLPEQEGRLPELGGGTEEISLPRRFPLRPFAFCRILPRSVACRAGRFEPPDVLASESSDPQPQRQVGATS